MSTAIFRKKTIYRSCDIHFELSYLQTLCNDFPALDIFLSSVTRGDASSLAKRNHYCTRDMIAATEAILNNPFGPKVQPYILASKVREILLAALEKVAVDMAKPLPVIRKNQQDALLHVKSVIELAGDTLLPLPELAKLAGLNEFTLKKGFRLLFGISPYQYYVEQKMKRAQQLLLETNDPVAMIAYELGYSQPSSFGHEFKKAMGMTPAELRKSKSA